MTLDEFQATLQQLQPPSALPPLLHALWWDANGDFDRAHTIAQEETSGPEHAWVHAYLHRKEGDPGNASYWYRQARQPHPHTSSDQEWLQMVTTLLQRYAG